MLSFLKNDESPIQNDLDVDSASRHFVHPVVMPHSVRAPSVTVCGTDPDQSIIMTRYPERYMHENITPRESKISATERGMDRGRRVTVNNSGNQDSTRGRMPKTIQ